MPDPAMQPDEPATVAPASPIAPVAADPQPINGQESGLQTKRSYKKPIIRTLLALLVLVVAAFIVALAWFNTQLSARSTNQQEIVFVVVASGATPSEIATLLESQGVIRSSTAFDIYVRLSGVRDKLQAGSYRLAPSEDVPAIVERLTKGSSATFNLTFFPGATLIDPTSKPASAELDVRTVLQKAGYGDDEINAALNKQYDHPVFASKPALADIEGYVYGETYNFNSGASVEDILIRTFDELYAVIVKNDLVARYEKQGLTLYEGITLASIIQREVITEADRKQVAQVFFSRLNIGMMLGSDVTYQYIADKTGVARDVNLDSPYNTRRYPGLPPGPIASPGLTALLAVADPAPGDFIYFLSGDDDVTYFGRTNAEHEANIRKHCAVKCLIL